MTESIVTKPAVDWRKPTCGCTTIHGSKDYCVGESTGMLACKCLSPPKNINYTIYYAFAQVIFYEKMHLTKNCEKWDSFL